MRALPLFGVVALSAACAAPPPAPVPPAEPAEPPAIETAAVAPATREAVPLAPAAKTAPAAPPAAPLPPSLGRAQVDKTFTHHRRFFNAAYLERLQARPRLAGTIQVSFTIQPDGSTRDVRRHSSTLDDAPLERAVLDLIDRMSFPPAGGPTPVERYPLQFSGQGTR